MTTVENWLSLQQRNLLFTVTEKKIIEFEYGTDFSAVIRLLCQCANHDAIGNVSCA